MLNELARINQAHRTDLVAADVEFSRPFLNLDASAARTEVDPQGIMGDVAGKEVLCLASGGGLCSAAGPLAKE